LPSRNAHHAAAYDALLPHGTVPLPSLPFGVDSKYYRLWDPAPPLWVVALRFQTAHTQ
jgi:hypothetical protein